MEYNFTVEFLPGLYDEPKIEIPDYLKEDFPTFVNQIKEFIQIRYNIEYTSLSISILRNKRTLKNVKDDIEIEQDDTLIVSLVNIKNFVPSNIQTGTSVKERKQISLNGHVEITDDEHNTYIGDVIDGKKHGYGKEICANGYTYEGEWKDDLKNGYGKETDGKVYSYDGYWKDDKYDGIGKYIDVKSSYEGEWKDYKKNGFGIEIIFDEFNSKMKGKYEGMFKNDDYNGIGILNLENGNIYEGEWNYDKESRKCFIGLVTYINGDIYNGHIGIFNLIKFGYGKMKYANGDIYDGEWNSNQEGYGKMTYANGDSFEGQWVTAVINDEVTYNLKSGAGIFIYANGNTVIGEWSFDNYYELRYFSFPIRNVIDKLNGSIRIEYHNGTYKGNIKNGKKDGYGEFIYNNGDKYIGEWKDGRKNGNGKMTYNVTLNDINSLNLEYKPIKGKGPDFGYAFKQIGSNITPLSYDGEWKNDDYVNGKTILSNHNVYEGDFKYNKMSGQGRKTYINGNISEGEFYNNKEKYCKIRYSNGDIYEGNLEGLIARGDGTMRYSNGDIYKGNWALGQKAFFGSMLYINGDFYEGQWHYDEKSRQGKMRYANGNVFIGNWKHDEPGHGKFTDKNGVVHERLI